MSLGLGGSGGFSRSGADRWAGAAGIANLAKPLSKPRKIMLRGDSTGIGFNTAYPSGNTAAQRVSPSRRMRDALIGAGFYAQDEFLVGSGGYTTAAGMTGFDPRLVVGAGWEYLASTTSVFGTLRNNSTANTYVFTPDTPCDTVTVYAQFANGKGTVDVTYGGITKSMNQANATTIWGSVTIGPADGATAGGAVTITRTSVSTTNVTVDAIWLRNSRLPAFQLLNGSASGMKAQNLANSGSLGASLYFPEQVLTAGDECWWQLGINDWKTAAPTDLATFKGYVEAWADRCILFGIIPRIILPIRSALTATTVPLMDSYEGAMREVAAAKSIAIYSFKDRWGEYAAANAKGLMAPDEFHANWYGSQDQGQFYAAIAASV